jgi:hypothetical protein
MTEFGRTETDGGHRRTPISIFRSAVRPLSKQVGSMLDAINRTWTFNRFDRTAIRATHAWMHARNVATSGTASEGPDLARDVPVLLMEGSASWSSYLASWL